MRAEGLNDADIDRDFGVTRPADPDQNSVFAAPEERTCPSAHARCREGSLEPKHGRASIGFCRRQLGLFKPLGTGGANGNHGGDGTRIGVEGRIRRCRWARGGGRPGSRRSSRPGQSTQGHRGPRRRPYGRNGADVLRGDSPGARRIYRRRPADSRQQGGCVSEIDGNSNRRSKHYGKFQGPRNRAAIIAAVAGVRRPPIGCRRRSVPKSDHRRGYQVELPRSCITSGGRRGAGPYVTGSACGKGRGPAGSGPADYRIGNADRVAGQPRGRRENLIRE